MTFSEGQTADASAADHTGSDAPAAQGPLFSDLIDHWLREGDRLQELAGEPEGGTLPQRPTRLDGWKARARELLGAAIVRHRLEVLIGIGLVPLGLFLLVAGHAAPPARPQVATALPAPAPAPPAPAVLLGPRVSPPARHRILAAPAVVQAKPVAVRPKQPPATKRAPAHPVQVVTRTAPARPVAPPAKPAAPAKPALAAPAKPQPALATKTAPRPTFVANPKVAPNLKLASRPRQR